MGFESHEERGEEKQALESHSGKTNASLCLAKYGMEKVNWASRTVAFFDDLQRVIERFFLLLFSVLGLVGVLFYLLRHFK